jgi:hypothetical protein
MAAACGRWGMPGGPPWDAGGGSRVHTYKQFAQPNPWRCFPADLRAVCIHRKQEPSQLKATSRITVSDPATSVAWCVT